MKKQIQIEKLPFNLFPFLAVLAAVLLATPMSMAHGDGAHGKKKHRQKQHYSYEQEAYYSTPPRRYARERSSSQRSYKPARHHSDAFSVPQKMKRHHKNRYQEYYYGPSYHRSHNHYHSVYRFPVRVDHGWEYRPHAYCEGSFFGVGRFTIHGPRFSLSLGW